MMFTVAGRLKRGPTGHSRRPARPSPSGLRLLLVETVPEHGEQLVERFERVAGGAVPLPDVERDPHPRATGRRRRAVSAPGPAGTAPGRPLSPRWRHADGPKGRFPPSRPAEGPRASRAKTW